MTARVPHRPETARKVEMAQDFGVNQGLVEELYLKYRENPASVADEWQAFFDSLEEDPLPPRRSSAGGIAAPTSAGLVPAPPLRPSIAVPPTPSTTPPRGNGQ